MENIALPDFFRIGTEALMILKLKIEKNNMVGAESNLHIFALKHVQIAFYSYSLFRLYFMSAAIASASASSCAS